MNSSNKPVKWTKTDYDKLIKFLQHYGTLQANESDFIIDLPACKFPDDDNNTNNTDTTIKATDNNNNNTRQSTLHIEFKRSQFGELANIKTHTTEQILSMIDIIITHARKVSTVKTGKQTTLNLQNNDNGQPIDIDNIDEHNNTNATSDINNDNNNTIGITGTSDDLDVNFWLDKMYVIYVMLYI